MTVGPMELIMQPCSCSPGEDPKSLRLLKLEGKDSPSHHGHKTTTNSGSSSPSACGRKGIAAGDHLLVQAPFHPFHLFLTVPL